MKNSYFFGIVFTFFTIYCFSQDCTTQSSQVINGDTTICLGDSATLTVVNSDPNIHYQLRVGVTDIGGPILGNGGNLDFIVTPSTASTYTYNVYAVECGFTYNYTVTVIVNPTPDVFTTNSVQAICSGESINSILFSGNVAGTTFKWTRNNFINVSGIPLNGSGDISGSLTNTNSSPRTITFTITPTANGCDGTPITATVVVNPIPVVTSSLPNQTRCSGVAIGSFSLVISVSGTTFQWTRDNTSNVTGVSNSGTGIPSGTPINNTNSPQTVNFTITPSANGCDGSPIIVSLLVNPTPNVAAAPSSQTICSGGTINSILLSGNVAGTTYTWTRTETIDLTGINPSGSGDITGSLTNNTNNIQTTVFTIRPNANGCNGPTTTASITVNPTPTAATVTTNQTVCSGVAIAPINFTGTVSLTSYNWTRDNTIAVTGLLNGSGTITGILTNTTSTQQTVNFTITPVANGCPGSPITATVIVEPVSLGGAVTIAPFNTNITTQCHTASGILNLSGQRGAIIRWEFSTNGGTIWTPISNTNNTYTYTGITQTTIYRAVVQNSPCVPAYSSLSIINIIPNIKPNPVTVSASTICLGDSVTLTAQSGFATSGSLASGGAFNNSNPPGWTVGSCGNCLNAGSSNTNPNPWQLSATNGGTYSGINYVSFGKFAIANGAFTSYLYTPTFNTFGLSTASLTFDQAYYLVTGASAQVQISVNGGAYTTLSTIAGTNPGPPTPPAYNIPFTPVFINLNNYLGQANLRIRFAYIGNTGSSWAVDNIQIPDVPSGLTMYWNIPGVGTVSGNTQTHTPTQSGIITYAVSSFLNGCSSFGIDGTVYVNVLVNPRPTAVISANQIACNGGTATFSVALTGTPPWKLTYFNGTTYTTINTINATPYNFNVANMTVNTTYTVTALNDSKCTAIASDLSGSATVTVLNGTAGLWTGLMSDDWFDCKNWSGPLPSATIDAVIPTNPGFQIGVPLGGPKRMPVINASAIAIARDIIIAPSASVTMIPNSNLHIKRDWKNSGLFAPGMGTVTFNGATNGQIQLINSGIKLNEAFYNLTLSSTGGAKGISLADGFQLTVANNLLLSSGDLRLVGEAQLVQSGISANPSGGTGKLVKDQQGTKSSFHYNYWSSPVSANNSTYTVAGVLRDGTNSATNSFASASNSDLISFGEGLDYADGPLSSPIKITNRWIYKYTNLSSSYFAWQHIGSTGSVKVGEGYTMKGVTGEAPNTDYQNYVFYGKPNNGTITLNIAQKQSYLVGNPYPSALDANEFIRDHIINNGINGGRNIVNVFNGAIYFWDHFGGYSHYLAEYIGGYACYTLMGGVVATSNDPLVDDNGTSGSKIPKQFIAVGQGFFIETLIYNGPPEFDPGLGEADGGDVVFKNSQRAFKIESTANSVFFKSANSTVSEDSDNRQKIRLSFEAPSGLKRPLLVGADVHTTNRFDIGYDAPMMDINPEDMYWEISDGKFVIQAIPNFNVEQIIPLGIKIANAGNSKIKIDELENIPTSTEIYLFDNATRIYHDIKNEDLIINLPVGEYNNRFSLRFTKETLNSNEVTLNNGIMVFVDSNNIMNIKNTILDVRVESVQLYNILGQSIAKWNVTDEVQQNIKIPVEHVRSGAYIVKLKTSNGSFSKKVIIR